MKLYLAVAFICFTQALKSQEVVILDHDSSAVFKYFDAEWNDSLYVPWPVLDVQKCMNCMDSIKFIVVNNDLKVSEFQILGDSIHQRFFYNNGNIRAYNITHRTTKAWLYKEYYYENGKKWQSLILHPDSLFPVVEYWENGNVKLEVNHYSGACWNKTRAFHENGKLKFEGQYKTFPENYKELHYETSQKTGTWKFYNSKGELIETKNYN